MAAMAAPRKVSIHDYPEHLNPFYEEDFHNKIRFWTLGRKLTRSNSITFSGIKDLKNSWALRSFMRKGKKQSSSQEKSKAQVNGESSPILYRRAMQCKTERIIDPQGTSTPQRSTVGSPERYMYGGSVTPLPRLRFQERLRSSSQYDANSLSMTPRMARSEVSGSRVSMESTNPFDEDEPVPPVRAARRKKKRAPPPPPAVGAADTSITSTETSELQISEVEDKKDTKAEGDLDLEQMKVDVVELKIVEDEDKNTEQVQTPKSEKELEIETIAVTNHELKIEEDIDKEKPEVVETLQIEEEDNTKPLVSSSSKEDILNAVSFSKVDIVKYRRNSSVNEDDIRLRRGNLEDFHVLSNKRSKSLNNNLDSTFVTYDINLNSTDHDPNGNDEPQKVVCKLYDEVPRKQSIDTISNTEKEFLEIDKATRELEREISKLNSALHEDDLPSADDRLSVSEIKRRFDKSGASSPNPIPKPRRSHYGGNNSS